jgi:hypothetical protein
MCVRGCTVVLDLRPLVRAGVCGGVVKAHHVLGARAGGWLLKPIWWAGEDVSL